MTRGKPGVIPAYDPGWVSKMNRTVFAVSAVACLACGSSVTLRQNDGGGSATTGGGQPTSSAAVGGAGGSIAEPPPTGGFEPLRPCEPAPTEGASIDVTVVEQGSGLCQTNLSDNDHWVIEGELEGAVAAPDIAGIELTINLGFDPSANNRCGVRISNVGGDIAPQLSTGITFAGFVQRHSVWFAVGDDWTTCFDGSSAYRLVFYAADGIPYDWAQPISAVVVETDFDGSCLLPPPAKGCEHINHGVLVSALSDSCDSVTATAVVHTPSTSQVGPYFVRTIRDIRETYCPVPGMPDVSEQTMPLNGAVALWR